MFIQKVGKKEGGTNGGGGEGRRVRIYRTRAIFSDASRWRGFGVTAEFPATLNLYP